MKNEWKRIKDDVLVLHGMEPEYWLSSLPQCLLSSGALRFCCVCTASCCQVYGGHLGLLWCLHVCTQPVHSEGDQPWDFFGGNDAEAGTPALWPPDAKSWLIGKDWCWEGLGAGGEGDDRGWHGWMASLTWWTWVWVNSGSWWWTGRPGVLQFMGYKESDTTERLNWTELNTNFHQSGIFGDFMNPLMAVCLLGISW